MALDNSILQSAVDLIRRSQKILITPSSPADGDSIGSALALYLVLRKLGKEPTVAMSDDLPEMYEFLPRVNEIHSEITGAKDFIITLDCKDAEVDTIKYLVEGEKVNIIVSPKSGRFRKEAVAFKNGSEQFDIIITVDAGDLHQMRELYSENKELFETLPLINIDHHASNSKFGTINYVDLHNSSTTQAIIPIIDALNKTGEEIIDPDIATLLLAGLITDTGSFQHSNTTPEAFEVASRLLELGAKQQEIIKRVYKTKSLSTLKLWGRVLSKLQYDETHRIVWSTITNQDLLETDSTSDESNGIIDELMSNAPGAELILLLKQKGDDLLSVSIRTNSDEVDGSVFAGHFGGGGHVRAAGCRVKGATIEEAEKTVIEYAKEFQAKRLGLVTSPKVADTESTVQTQPQSQTPAPVAITAEQIVSTPVINEVKEVEISNPEKVEVIDRLTRDFFK